MKEEIQNITAIMKEIARIKDKYQQKFPNSSTIQMFRDIETDLADIRDLLDFD